MNLGQLNVNQELAVENTSLNSRLEVAGTSTTNYQAHVNNPAGERLELDGQVVPAESPEAHCR